eukprot:1524176-Rhodomonas_salina.2
MGQYWTSARIRQTTTRERDALREYRKWRRDCDVADDAAHEVDHLLPTTSVRQYYCRYSCATSNPTAPQAVLPGHQWYKASAPSGHQCGITLCYWAAIRDQQVQQLQYWRSHHHTRSTGTSASVLLK